MTTGAHWLVTGASSFLGRELCRALTESGARATALLRPTSDTSGLAALPAPPDMIVDTGASEALTNALSDAAPDGVMHIAGRYIKDGAEDQDANPATMVDANVGFGTRLLSAMQRAGIKRLVNTGSYFEHMDGDGARPLNLYAATKQAFMSVLEYHADAHGLQASTLVLYDTFGPGDTRGKLMQAIRNATRNGTTLPVPAEDPALDMVYISDVTAAYVTAGRLLVENPSAVAGRRFAVRHGTPVTIRGMVAAFERVSGRTITTETGAWPAPSRTISVMWDGPPLPGWQPEVTLDDGIRLYLQEEATDAR